jgi:DNA polymerase
VTQDRGRLIPSDLVPAVIATVHPSSILRAEAEERAAQLDAFVDDLRAVARVIRSGE